MCYFKMTHVHQTDSVTFVTDLNISLLYSLSRSQDRRANKWNTLWIHRSQQLNCETVLQAWKSATQTHYKPVRPHKKLAWGSLLPALPSSSFFFYFVPVCFWIHPFIKGRRYTQLKLLEITLQYFQWEIICAKCDYYAEKPWRSPGCREFNAIF